MEFEIVKIDKKESIQCGDIIRKGGQLFMVFDCSLLDCEYSIALLELSTGSVSEGFESLLDLKSWIVFDELIKSRDAKLTVISRYEKED